jgi:hypothetical protein
MAGNKKPRKKMNHNKRISLDPAGYAIRLAAKLTDAERALLMNPVKECFGRLRFGGFTVTDYKHLADTFNVAQSLTMPGIGLLPDHADKFRAAHMALKDLGERYNAGRNWAARGEELRAIETGIEFHEIQLQFASAGELTRATQEVDRALKGVLSGSKSRNIFTTELREAA